MTARLIITASFLVASFSALADSLYENTNLALFDLPDVLADGVEPYDERLFEIDTRIAGKRCCERQMYRVDGKKIVLLSHDGAYFMAITITDDEGTRMFYANKPGVFEERNVEEGGTWSVPDWLRAKAEDES